LAVFIYAFASLANSWGIIFSKAKVEKAGLILVWAGLLVHSGALVFRWIAAGHGPYISKYEVLSSNAWVMLVFFLLFARIYPRIRQISIIVFPAAFLLIAIGMFMDTSIQSLPPTLNSLWLILHVAFYKISLATLLTSLAFSLLYILKNRTSYPWLDKIPDNPVNDAFAYRFAGFGFIFWAIAMLSGSIWAYQSWGRFWGWDAIEIWSLGTWIIFGLYLHMRKFFDLKGERAAYFFILCFVISLLCIFIIPLVDTSVHSSYFR
ncbi:MAG: cytochrome c biogenesis protein CcsA, partial [Proteobacteria bacterium]|nr:cytochrome c biogenesis protein CcsA [Pseudomonadota bacterium]